MDQLAKIARAQATYIFLCEADGCDGQEIDQAWEYLAEGDALREQGAFRDAVAKYKDALAKAESALQSCK
jgi:predicted S18 family serine protease